MKEATAEFWKKFSKEPMLWVMIGCIIFLVIFLNSCAQTPDRLGGEKPSIFDPDNSYLVMIKNDLPTPQHVEVYTQQDTLLYKRVLGVSPLKEKYDINDPIDTTGKDKGDTWMPDPWIGYGPQKQQPKFAGYSDVMKMLLPLGKYRVLVSTAGSDKYEWFVGIVDENHVKYSEGPLVWHLEPKEAPNGRTNSR